MLKITLECVFSEIKKIYNKLMLKMIKILNLTIMKILKNS
jgi:hypothetical protein